ncbi:MAG: carbohydrate ABC transporter permease [Lachnospiraceae bacterium]|nr:carbohydrate ABC transporter permease [Lachnospiraceae bacterium]MBR2403673.1 carbohydrate ABC transporter permease [Lachnospiraceae bacterium]MBR3683407.1 carbohydrate ABC transporter permease [Lachnospiraceae bacterium]
MAYKGHKINPKRFEKGQIKIILMVLPLVLITGLPIIFIIFHAFKPMEELFAFPPKFITTNPTFDNFRQLFKASRSAGIPLSRYVFNSILITGAVVFSSLVFSTAAAYALSKLKFKGRAAMLQINQIAIMFVPVAVMIPRYLVVNVLGLTNTYWAQILPLIPLPVALFLVKQFVDQVPQSLIEAAYMDGAKELQIYTKVIIPLIKPAIATAAILVFQQVWTNIEASNYYVNDDGLKSLAFYMNTLTSTTTTNTVAGQGISAAASLIMFIPNLVLFCILQNSVMNTMAHSGIK